MDHVTGGDKVTYRPDGCRAKPTRLTSPHLRRLRRLREAEEPGKALGLKLPETNLFKTEETRKTRDAICVAKPAGGPPPGTAARLPGRPAGEALGATGPSHIRQGSLQTTSPLADAPLYGGLSAELPVTEKTRNAPAE